MLAEGKRIFAKYVYRLKANWDLVGVEIDIRVKDLGQGRKETQQREASTLEGGLEEGTDDKVGSSK